MGQSQPLFVYFCSYLITISIQFEKSVVGVLGIQTQGSRMVGEDETMELWWPPKRGNVLHPDFHTKDSWTKITPFEFSCWHFKLSQFLKMIHIHITLFVILYQGYSRVRSDCLNITPVPSGFVQKDAKLVLLVA